MGDLAESTKSYRRDCVCLRLKLEPSIRRMRLETDEAFERGRRLGKPRLSLGAAVGNNSFHFLRHNKLHNHAGKPRSASGRRADSIDRWTSAEGVATSSVECTVSGSRLRAKHKLGARERPCGTDVSGT